MPGASWYACSKSTRTPSILFFPHPVVKSLQISVCSYQENFRQYDLPNNRKIAVTNMSCKNVLHIGNWWCDVKKYDFLNQKVSSSRFVEIPIYNACRKKFSKKWESESCLTIWTSVVIVDKRFPIPLSHYSIPALFFLAFDHTNKIYIFLWSILATLGTIPIFHT